jgi:thiol-disulfide isomerase/thioredoxin
MKRRSLLMMGAAGGVAAAAGIVAAVWRSSSALSAAEADFWGMRFERPEGGELVLATLRGKPVLLNFWATWCAPCVTEMPLLDRFHRQQESRGWQVVGLAVDSLAPVRQFLSQHQVGFAIGLAGGDGVELAHSLGNTSGALPFSVVFDRSGKVKRHKLGVLGTPDLEAWAGAVT